MKVQYKTNHTALILIPIIIFIFISVPIISILAVTHKMPTLKNVDSKYWNILESAYGIKFTDKSKVEYTSFWRYDDGNGLYIKLSVPSNQINEFKKNFSADSYTVISDDSLMNEGRVKWFNIKKEDYDYTFMHKGINGLTLINFSKEKNGKVEIYMDKCGFDEKTANELSEYFKKDLWPYD